VTTADAATAERQMSKVPVRTGKVPSKYAPLHNYLANRYADTVVLTFAQLEDLTGGPLPEPARAQQEWWTSTERDADKSSRADAWLLAGRTAQPNLMAQTVTFERAASPFETRAL
jgi:hypothetical protein